MLSSICISLFPFTSLPWIFSHLLKFNILISSPNTSEQQNRDGGKHQHITHVSRGHTLSSAQLSSAFRRASCSEHADPDPLPAAPQVLSRMHIKAGLPRDFFQPVAESDKTTLAGLFLTIDSPNSQPLLGDLTSAWSRPSQVCTQSDALLPSFPVFPFISQVSSLHPSLKTPLSYA